MHRSYTFPVLVALGLVCIALGIYDLYKRAPALPAPTVATPAPPAHNSAKVITVSATEKWQDSGVKVKSGQRVSIFASGFVVWDQALPETGPNGTYPASTIERPSDFPLPSAPCGSLIMKLGQGIYPVGASHTLTAKEDGTLYFMVNDRLNYLFNNSGSFNVEVTVE